MKTSLFTLLVLAGGLLLSCNNAGSGGRAQLNIHVIYDNSNVPDGQVRLMYDATGFPGAGASYDELDTSDHTGKNSFGSLRRGAYYVYVEAMHDTGTGPVLLQGGASAKIKNSIGEQHIVIDLAQENPF